MSSLNGFLFQVAEISYHLCHGLFKYDNTRYEAKFMIYVTSQLSLQKICFIHTVSSYQTWIYGVAIFLLSLWAIWHCSLVITAVNESVISLRWNTTLIFFRLHALCLRSYLFSILMILFSRCPRQLNTFYNFDSIDRLTVHIIFEQFKVEWVTLCYDTTYLFSIPRLSSSVYHYFLCHFMS